MRGSRRLRPTPGRSSHSPVWAEPAARVGSGRPYDPCEASSLFDVLHHALGSDASDVLRRCWDGKDFGDLDLHLIALTPKIAGLAERHLAYPVVHYFHSGARSTALGPAIVTLDEILTLNEHAVEEEHRIGPSVVEPLRAAITTFLDTLETAFIGAAEADIKAQELDDLRDDGVPVVDEDAMPGDLDYVQERRRLLRGYLEEDGWSDAGLLPREDDPDAAPVPGRDGRS